MIPEPIQQRINAGKALVLLHPKEYPARYNKRIPLRVRMTKTVTSDMPLFLMLNDDSPKIAIGGNEYYVSVNSYGAVTAIFEDGSQLGLKPDEFEVTEFHK